LVIGLLSLAKSHIHLVMLEETDFPTAIALPAITSHPDAPANDTKALPTNPEPPVTKTLTRSP